MQNTPKLFNKNLVLLILCQGIFLVNNITFVAINGLVGLSLSRVAWMATLPIMGYVVGGALSTSIVARAQKRFGRQKSFQLGLLVAIVSSLICAYAAYSKNFWLLVFGTFVAGYYSANGQLYRFAAAELTDVSLREKAISWVLAGGIIGAVVGPNLANYTKDSFDTPFLGAYLILTVAGFLGLLVMHFIEFPKVSTAEKKAAGTGRTAWELLKQPVFLVAAISSALGYGVMNLLMAATPLAMKVCGLPFSDAAFVLEWHVIGMFAPGFFTGSLIKKYGTGKIMWLGIFLNFVCILIALSGVDVMHFMLASFILGVGWNFLFTSATNLAMTAYRPEEKDRAQGVINFFVFTTMAVTSFSSGALVTTSGWDILNLGSLFPVVLMGVALLWLRHKDAQEKNRAAAV